MFRRKGDRIRQCDADHREYRGSGGNEHRGADARLLSDEFALPSHDDAEDDGGDEPRDHL